MTRKISIEQTKIYLQHHDIRDLVNGGKISVQWVLSSEMLR